MKGSQVGKILLLLMTVLLSTILQTGCAFKDIDKLAFVVGIGVDPAEENEDNDKYKITLKIAQPIGSLKQATEPEYSYLSYESETIGESLRMLATHVDKSLEFGHTKIIVINEKLLTEELKVFMDYFTRRGDIQLVAWVAAARPSAEQILKTEPKTESPASISLFNFFDGNGTESPYIVTTFLFDFRRDHFGKGINPVLPLIQTNEDKSELIINKALVVKQLEESLELSSIQTKQYNTLAHQMGGTNFKVKDEELTLLLNFERLKMNYKIVTELGRAPRIDVKVKMIGIIGESNQSLELKKLDQYNAIANKEFHRMANELLKTFQENDVDPFGFGLRYRATRLNTKDTFSDWERIYPTIDFNVSVDVRLQSTGAIE